jgi:hypothetical protein
MLEINKSKSKIAMCGDSDTLKDEIGTLMLSFAGESAKHSKEAALDVYNHYVKSLAGIAGYLDDRFGIDVGALLEEELEEVEQKAKEEEKPKKAPPIDKELDDAISAFFSSLDEIIAKKKGDK